MIIPIIRIKKGAGTLALETHRNPPSECSGGNGVAAHYEYTPYGAIADSTTSTGAGIDFRAHNPFRFSSEYADDALGLASYTYRHYNPQDGRWTGYDLIEDDRTLQAYQFCHNAPSVLFDYLGCDWFALPSPPEGGWNAPPHVVSPPVPHPIGPTQLEKDRDELEAVLAAYCPLGDMPITTKWGTKCCKDSCKEQAKQLADLIYDVVEHEAKEYGSAYGNILNAYEHPFECLLNRYYGVPNRQLVANNQPVAWGCTDWQSFIDDAFKQYKKKYPDTKEDGSKGERCFDAQDGYQWFCTLLWWPKSTWWPAGRLDVVHNWEDIIPPDSSNRIQIDLWWSGGRRLFPW